MTCNKSRLARRKRRYACGALLLALPLYGLAMQAKPVEAQPTTNPPTTFQPAPLTPKQQADIERINAITRYEEFCKMPLDLKLENGTIDDAIKRIKAAFPTQQVEIRQRDVRPLKLSVDLKDTTVGTVLSGMAALSDSVLWVMPDSLLIAPPGKLTQAEQDLVGMMYAGPWIQSGENPTNAGNAGNAAISWTAQQDADMLFANIIADEIKLLKVDGPVKTTFGQFSPQAQKALWQLVTWSNNSRKADNPNSRPLILSLDSPVKIEFEVGFRESKWISIDLTKGASDPYATQIFMSLLLSE